jgi:hypothetical protein
MTHSFAAGPYVAPSSLNSLNSLVTGRAPLRSQASSSKEFKRHA